jgi:hypothetical protein
MLIYVMAPLELVEFDVQKGTRIMKCQECGLYHFHKKELFGDGSFLKSAKKPAWNSLPVTLLF